jgi:CheY-like chemotaxis protein/HPt (histidine-containing phosphotransfer) domain-containing protein
VELDLSNAAPLAERFVRCHVPDVWIVDAEHDAVPKARALADLLQRVGEERWPLIVALCPDGSMPKALEAVADAGLRYPLTPAHLFQAVLAALTRRRQPTERLMRLTRLDAVGVQWLSSVALLIVDDSEINLEVARRILEREGAKVESFDNAPSALARLKACATDVDAVLMDVQMPGMDGNAAMRAIRDELGLTALPVIALSAGAFVSERRRAIDAGMIDFVCKPIDPDTLIRTVRMHVERARGSPLGLKVASRHRGRRAEAAVWPQIEGIDSHDAAHRLKNNVDLFAVMLTCLLSEFGPGGPASVTLELGQEAGRKALAARMHKLRGSAGMLGASVLQRLAVDADVAARSDATEEQLEQAQRRVAQQLASLAQQSRPFLEALAAARTDTASKQEVEPLVLADLQRLIAQLQAHDLAALDLFALLEPALRAALGPTAAGPLRSAVERLEFDGAAGLLRPLLVDPSAIAASPTVGTDESQIALAC